MKNLLIAMVCILVMAGFAAAQPGTKKKKPKPYDYGKVTINNFSSKSGMAPAEFNHWSHRSKFTCRLCHVDIGFAMRARETQIKAEDNIKGYFCGTCHNDVMTVDGRKVFAACAKEPSRTDIKRCEKCHVTTPDASRTAAFQELADRLPRERGGNGINWELAEERGLIKLTDHIEGVSIKRPQMAAQKDFSISSKVAGMPEIIFSHKKHTVWNGCEVCHPEIFVGVKKGATRYSMIELFEGKYCGVCHDTVAFPQTDCQRCHAKPVQ